jgi:hypothetical protein
MNRNVVKTDYFRLGQMTVICLLTLDNGYEIIGTATKKIINTEDEEEAKGVAYQRALYQVMELEAMPITRTVGVMPIDLPPPIQNHTEK